MFNRFFGSQPSPAAVQRPLASVADPSGDTATVRERLETLATEHSADEAMIAYFDRRLKK